MERRTRIRRALWAAFALGLVVLAGCSEERKLYRDAELLQQQGYYQQAIERYQDLLVRFPETEFKEKIREQIAASYVGIAEQAAKIQKYSDSVKAIETLLAEYPDSKAAKMTGLPQLNAYLRKLAQRSLDIGELTAAQVALMKLLKPETPEPDRLKARQMLDQIGRIAFSTSTGLWTVNPDGSELRKVLDRGVDPYFSPEGTALAYIDAGRPAPKARRGVLKIYDFAKGSSRRVFKQPIAVEPSWSPDGSRLAVNKKGFTQLVPVRGGKPETFPPAAEMGFVDGGAPLYQRVVDWNGDGTKLLGYQRTSRSGAFHLSVVAADFTSAFPVHTHKKPFRDAAWSHGGKQRIGFVSEDGLWLIQPSGIDLYNLLPSKTTEWDLASIAFSPDGRWLAAVARRGGGPWGLIVVNSDRKVIELKIGGKNRGDVIPTGVSWGVGRNYPAEGGAAATAQDQ